MATLEEALEQAAANRNAGRLDVAEQVYRAILAKFPQHGDARAGLDEVLRTQGKSADQLGVLQDSELQHLMTLYETGALADAERHATALIERFPKSLVLYNVLGATLLDLNKPEAAVACFRNALDLEPGAAESHNNLAIALHRHGAYQEATERFQQASDLRPDFADAHKNAGALYFDMQRIEDAVSALRRGDPDNRDPDSSALVLECYFHQGNRTAFDIQLQMIRLQQDAINIRACAAAAYAAQQHGSDNIYEFCAAPFDKISILKLPEFDGSEVFFEHPEVDHCAGEFQGADFVTENRPASLEAALRRAVETYRNRHENDGSLHFRAWPRDCAVAIRRIEAAAGAAAPAHIHRSWMSGFACLGAGGGATVEFTLRGYDLPVLREDYPRETVGLEAGSCVLFPASLPHRIDALSTGQDSALFAFDVVPM